MTDLFDLDGPQRGLTRCCVMYDNGRVQVCEDSVIQPDGAPARPVRFDRLAAKCTTIRCGAP
jgi:hypothetical protein